MWNPVKSTQHWCTVQGVSYLSVCLSVYLSQFWEFLRLEDCTTPKKTIARNRAHTSSGHITAKERGPKVGAQAESAWGTTCQLWPLVTCHLLMQAEMVFSISFGNIVVLMLHLFNEILWWESFFNHKEKLNTTKVINWTGKTFHVSLSSGHLLLLRCLFSCLPLPLHLAGGKCGAESGCIANSGDWAGLTGFSAQGLTQLTLRCGTRVRGHLELLY